MAELLRKREAASVREPGPRAGSLSLWLCLHVRLERARLGGPTGHWWAWGRGSFSAGVGLCQAAGTPREPGERGGVSGHHTDRVRVCKIAFSPCKSAFLQARHRVMACRVCSLSIVSVIRPDHPLCSSTLFPDRGQTTVLDYHEKNHLASNTA